MRPERYQQIHELFTRARQQSAELRKSILDQACVDDRELREEVEALLAADTDPLRLESVSAERVEALLAACEEAGSQESRSHGLASRSTLNRASGSQPTGSADGRFVPGTRLASRYRIVGRLGRGGMGEVYRADDLTLGVPVALKFLPPALAGDPQWLAWMRNEVRLARDVAHPNVCRVYDIAEAEGEHFISMEYVDGEDLGVLLRRIGRLPNEKAVQIAQQLCAGLAAAHGKGVLHCDLKPANVMLDGRGHVRITDFGIATLATRLEGREIRAGTPGYMAPEQLAGRDVSIRSDVYSLGLVLYELFTGKRAIEAESIREILQLHESGTPTSMSDLVEDFDPAIERVVFRCLEKDPQMRPATAVTVAAGLPGGDPLAAALAAGETPSPEMVAAAGGEGLLRPAVAATLLALIILGLAAHVLMADRVWLLGMVAPPKQPDALADHATEVIRRLGIDEVAFDRAWGFEADVERLDSLQQNSRESRRDKLRSAWPPPLTFWYRQSPEPLAIVFGGGGSARSVSPLDPSPLRRGMVGVSLDAEGRLLELLAVPQADAPDALSATEAEQLRGALLDETGLTRADRFAVVDPDWTPPVYCDGRLAWEEAIGAGSDGPVRIEAGFVGGRPTVVRILTPWETRDEQKGVPWFVAILLVLTGGLLLAWRQVRLGRGDRRGAFRVAVFVFVTEMAYWLLAVSGLPASGGRLVGSLLSGISSSVYWAVICWVLYLALEPYVRRRWPHRIVSWSRLLAGRWRDPVIGRDILIGVLAGVAVSACLFAALDWTFRPPRVGWLPALSGPGQLAGGAIFAAGFSIYAALFYLIGPLALQILLRRFWLAICVFWALIVLAATADRWLIGGPDFVLLAYYGLSVAAFIFVVVRFGLLSGTAMFFAHTLLYYCPATTQLSAWFARPYLCLLAVLILLAVFAFSTSLAGRLLFRDSVIRARAS